MTSISPESPPPEGRRARRAAATRGRTKAAAVACAVVLGTGVAVGIGMAAGGAGNSGPAAAPARHAAKPSTTTASTAPTTTTTTLPALVQPAQASLPSLPGQLGPGSNADVVRAYQQRLADLHFDPGPVDGNYGQDTIYAVQTLQKMFDLPRNGRIGTAEALHLIAFQYPAPLQPTGEANRTEIDVAKQVLTLYENYQVRLITTT